MRIGFVGIRRKYQELDPSYRGDFTRYHLELPFYFSRDGKNDVCVTTVDYTDNGGCLRHMTEGDFLRSDEKLDVIVHWRRWFRELYRSEALNFINCQDHSFGPEWKFDVVAALERRELDGILCFPTWHKTNLAMELGMAQDDPRLISGTTLGVDTEIYRPHDQKDPRELLWASDPGRGLEGAVRLAIKLWQRDRRFKLNIVYPDYVRIPPVINHPAVKVIGCLKNDPKLWDLFGRCGILPYTSVFKEPSSRAHRQAMAAGCLVLYPPDMGSPSFLIDDGKTGYVRDIDTWADLIVESIADGSWSVVGSAARKFAIEEDWRVQAGRFNETVRKMIEARGR